MTALEEVRAACARAGVRASEKNMFGGVGFLAQNGRMFAGSWDGGKLLLKLEDEATRHELLSIGGRTWIQRSPGRTREMPSWVVAPASIRRDGPALAGWVARAHEAAAAAAEGRVRRRAAKPKRAPSASARMGNLELIEDACDRARLARTTRAMFGGHGLFASNGGTAAERGSSRRGGRGAMFAGIVDDDRIILKLADEAARADLEAAGGRAWVYRAKTGDMTMKEWILVPDAFYDDPAALAAWAKRAYELAPAKATTKNAKKARLISGDRARTSKKATSRPRGTRKRSG